MNSLTLEPSVAVDVPVTSPAVEPVAAPKARRPRVWSVFAALILSLAAGIAAYHAALFAVAFGLGFVMGAQGADMSAFPARYEAILMHPLMNVVLTYIPFQFSMLTIVLLAARLSPEPLKQRVGLLPQTGRKFGVAKAASMAGFTLACGYVVNIVMILLIGAPESVDPIATAITDGSWWTIAGLSVLISVVPGLVEEIFFRGYMQRRFLKRWSPAVAITATTIVFALMHADSLQHIIAVIPLSVVTGLLAYRSNSVKPGMIVHGVHNAAVVGIGTALTALPQYVSEEVLGLGFLASIPVLGLIGLPAVISLLRTPKTQPNVAAYVVPTETVETPSVLKRELALPEFATESRATTQAV